MKILYKIMIIYKIFVIKDFVTAKDNHFVERFFYLDNKCKMEWLEKRCFEIESGEHCIYLIDDNDLELEIFGGSLNPIIGWQS